MLKSLTSRIIFVLILALVSCVCSFELPDPSLTDYHDNKNTIHSTLPPDMIRKQDKESEDDSYKSEKSKNDNNEKKDKYDDDDDDKKYNSHSSSPSKTEKENHKSNAKTSNDDGHKTKSDSDASNTVITTIIVIATETPTPTQIYTGSNQNPANQKGESSGSNTSNDGSNTDSSGSTTDPNATSTDGNQGNKGRSNYRKMELALSIVGSVGGTALIAGLLILTRRQINKKKKAAQKSKDLELGNSPSAPPMATAPSNSGGSSNQAIIVPHNQGNNDSVIIDFENPFSDPVTYRKFNQMQLTDSPITPVAPVHLAPGSYINFRQNQTLSMLSQTTAAVPSAPTEKEIAANENENPFELEATPQYYAQQMSYQHEASHSRTHSHSVSHSHLHSVPHSHSVSQNSFGSNRIENGLEYSIIQHLSPPPTTISTTITNNKNHNLSRSMSSPTGTNDDLSELPPPAYTPSAIPSAISNPIPSAPPLYALPNLSRSQQEESRRLSALYLSSRRHSISSIASADIRPLPLRRGSGSIAHITSSFS